MKIALAVAALVLAFQQQTFYSASAKPKPVPAHTAQPLPAGYIYNGGKHRTGKRSAKSTGSPATHKQTASHPAPRHT
jgi:hypothetical protein